MQSPRRPSLWRSRAQTRIDTSGSAFGQTFGSLVLFKDLAERLPVKACQHANLMWPNISHLAVSLDAEDPPFKFRVRQVGE